MNIFCTDMDPKVAAHNLCDIHLRKMLLETAQMLCTSARAMGESTGPYGDTQKGHKCNKWVQESRANWDWLVEHGMEINRAYMERNDKGHKAWLGIIWASRQDPPDEVFSTTGLTPFANSVWPPLDKPYETPDHGVQSYREFYGRKELVWALLGRAQALARVASGRTVTLGFRPVMRWGGKVDSRPLWMPDRVPEWRPSPSVVGEAESYGSGRRTEMDFSLKKMGAEHRIFFIDLSTQDYEGVDVDVAKELIRLTA